MVKSMKNFIALLLVVTMALTSFSCSNTTNTSQTSNNKTQETSNISETTINANESTSKTNETTESSTNDTELVSKIKKLCNKEVVKTALNGKTISQLISEEINKLTEEEKKDATKNYPEMSFDQSNFANDEKTYIWLSKALKVIIKDSIEKGNLTQDMVNEYKGYLTLMGVSLPNVEIKKGMADEDIEKLSLAFIDVADRVTEPAVLKLMGVDLNDPETLENLKNVFINK